MLVLSRKRGESILIGENVSIKILDIRGNTIRIGIEAPKDIPISRSELLENPPEEE